MGVTIGIWIVLNVVILAMCIWIPNMILFLLPLAVTFIIALLIAMFNWQREQMEALEARLERMEALLKERLPEPDERTVNTIEEMGVGTDFDHGTSVTDRVCE